MSGVHFDSAAGFVTFLPTIAGSGRVVRIEAKDASCLPLLIFDGSGRRKLARLDRPGDSVAFVNHPSALTRFVAWLLRRPPVRWVQVESIEADS